MRLGESPKFIICGYELTTSLGNINPLGVKYQGKDVFCSPFRSIWEAETFETAGGRTYYKKGTELVSYSYDKTMCCKNSECPDDVCENYKCKDVGILCQHGNCNPLDPVETKCKQEGTEFYLTTTSCGSDGCTRIEKEEVACCDEYCSQFTTPTQFWYCDLDTGCDWVGKLQECGAGFCCKDGGQFIEQECPGEHECCWNQDLSDYRGVCAESCTSQEIFDFNWNLLILSIFGGLIAFAISNLVFRKAYPAKKDTLIVNIGTIAFGAFAGYFIYLYWWLILIIGILAVILFVVMKAR
jgi:hypothetical protein